MTTILCVITLSMFFAVFYFINSWIQRTAFTCGWMLAYSVTSLTQDATGRENYAKQLLENWIPASYSIPLAILCIVLVMLILRGLNRTTKEISIVSPPAQKEG